MDGVYWVAGLASAGLSVGLKNVARRIKICVGAAGSRASQAGLFN